MGFIGGLFDALCLSHERMVLFNQRDYSEFDVLLLRMETLEKLFRFVG